MHVSSNMNLLATLYGFGKPTSLVAPSDRSAVVSPSSPDRGMSESDAAQARAEAEGMRPRAPRESHEQLRQRIAAADARWAEIAAADEKRGFRQTLTTSLKTTHARALQAPVGEAGFDTRDEAMSLATALVGRSQTAIRSIASSTELIERSEASLRGEVGTTMSPEELELRVSLLKDNAGSQSLELDIQAGHLRSMFSVTAPTYTEREDGTIGHAAYEVRHSKYGLLISVDADGRRTEHGPGGVPLVPEGQAVNQLI